MQLNAEQSQLSPMYFLQLMRGRIWHIITLALAVAILSTVVVFSMKPVYESTAVLLLEPEQAQNISLADLFYVDSRGSAYVNTQKEIIRSRKILNALVEELQIEQEANTELTDKYGDTSWIDALFNRVDQDKGIQLESKQALIDAVRSNLTIYEVPQSKLIELSVRWSTAEMSAILTNTLARMYIQETLDARMEMARQASSWMRERTTSLKEKLTVAENKLQSFIEAEGLVNLDQGVNALTSQELTEQTNRAMAAKAKVNELSQRYGAKHPKLIAAKTELAQAEREMQSGKNAIRSLGRTDIKLKELQHEVTSTRELYETYLSRVKETEESGTLRTATARIIDEAIAPTNPIKPKKKLIVIVSFVLTLVFGVGLVFLQEMLDSTIRSVEQVESKLGLPLLGLLPQVKFKNKDITREEVLKNLVSGDNPFFSEAIRTIRTGIMLSAIDNPHKVILVTSSLPGEGKSTVAANLAIAMGKMEKVLLIDADMRRPVIKKQIGLDLTDDGLSELVAGTAEHHSVIQHNEEFGIDIIHAGTIPPNPLELLSSKRFATVLDSFKEEYDRIIIDSTPVQYVSDALVLSQYVSGVVYVIHSDSTSEHMAIRCLKRLNEVNVPIIGVVLNMVDMKNSTKHGYGGYYERYGYGPTYEENG
ncbi:MAG: hypothetical protein CO186_05560 [Zetaproteobacteria bacterium CG_4_9_14_3_um_filter_49_83]|nr:MAG: hypothetical protein AUJ56_01190 [Zetaproteobacteria bacterium CG1_02_49_23]PIQ33836.1 MAG: hypothetical protein COW62_04145 [Zetaproteobacteria bacterium CG17_big_fil_post_rev_8_21_14_2_50_50_13]PIV29509.1 MAG: hypothetical protein COS35_11735 [Zetaproteobacteria bacterium CG02_land_8_20_14_3_00_50_9]PIY55572.1 MAG: hypothetical protein COZ00_08630 [Zetaproteobacteria bacterium CG_4_10_14_0_8_um_filter_49_80]PJA35464.1 MAG: hypothetical protein CO186_05560 [Zetaproteobacteria bacterium